MVSNKKANERWIETSERENPSSKSSSDIGGLSASLEGLKNIADHTGKEHNKKETAGLVERVKEAGEAVAEKNGVHSIGADNVDEASRQKTWSTMHKQLSDKEQDKEGSLGVVELLGALKADIDGLRKENKEFKAQLMHSPLASHNASSKRADDSTELRGLLEALKADIGNLREENDQLRSQTIAASVDKGGDEVLNEQEVELYQMLGELKQDIDGLRSANDTLRQKKQSSDQSGAHGANEQVANILHELKEDMSELKHENESLRLENLTARDGARFNNLGGQDMAYRNEDENAGSGFLKGLGVVMLAAGAAGGGYYMAKTQTALVAVEPTRSVQVSNGAASTGSSKSVLLEKVMKTSRPVVKIKPLVKPKVRQPVAKQVKKQPPQRSVSGKSRVGGDGFPIS
ncbi:MAG: hypothetical protein L3J67_00570 [Hyphomicrobiaceae bacterium]|nr:hypothetical protein [Hyphomicrobiaceae bacterium]